MKRIVQFAYKDGPPPRGLPVVDCRTIENPFARAKDEDARKALVKQDPMFPGVVESACSLLRMYDTIAVGCTFGRHRSGTVAEAVATRTGACVVPREEFRG